MDGIEVLQRGMIDRHLVFLSWLPSGVESITCPVILIRVLCIVLMDMCVWFWRLGFWYFFAFFAKMDETGRQSDFYGTQRREQTHDTTHASVPSVCLEERLRGRFTKNKMAMLGLNGAAGVHTPTLFLRAKYRRRSSPVPSGLLLFVYPLPGHSVCSPIAVG